MGSSTQPMPALPSAGPLFTPAQQPAPAMQTGQSGQGAVPPEPPLAEEPAAPTPERPRRKALYGVAAVAALVVALGAPTADRYLFYKSGQPTDIVHVAEPGGEVTFNHVSWQASVERFVPPAGTVVDPGKQWLKAVITRKAVDADGAQLIGPPELQFEDLRGRRWQVEISDDKKVPLENHEIGRPYPYEALAIVPADVADEVRLRLRPSTYRADTPTSELMRPATEEEMELQNHLLLFKR
ncbi:hypothetical protein ACIBG7_05490 [Nonomuraea sp. NPDC050328]|uniref:hypothetical protein n=1 Tax=Nonomuraea sp. NPDC050328 TaxID=3364361 RepID=UPI0037BBD6DE